MVTKKKVKRKKAQRRTPTLCVAFDTNVLHTDAAHHLLRREVKELIRSNSNHLDLNIEWYLPSAVVGEREYQMQRRAFGLFKHVQNLDKLLGHQSTTRGIILGRISSVIDEQLKELGIRKLEVNSNDVEWQGMIDSSVYRRPPFDPGEKEKGFRDAVIAEAFLQLVSRSPTTPSQCRLALVSDDGLLRTHIEQRTAKSKNVRVLESISDLESLINTLVSEVPEAKVAKWREKAKKYFFVPKDESTLYHKKDIYSMLTTAYAAELAETPTGQHRRKNGTWYISAPVFSKKVLQRIHWTTQISIGAELFEATLDVTLGLPAMSYFDAAQNPLAFVAQTPLALSAQNPLALSAQNPLAFVAQTPLALSAQPEEKVGTGKSVIELHWSVSISPQQERLSSPKIEGHEFIGTTWEMAQIKSDRLGNVRLNYL